MGAPHPDYNYEFSGLMISFPGKPGLVDRLVDGVVDNSEKNIATRGKTVRKTVGKTVGKIIEAISEKPEITRKELADELKLSVRGVEWNLAKLKKEGKIKRKGPAKGGHWEIIAEGYDDGK